MLTTQASHWVDPDQVAGMPNSTLLLSLVRDTASSLDGDEIMRRVVTVAATLLRVETALLALPHADGAVGGGDGSTQRVVCGPPRRPRLYWQQIELGPSGLAERAVRAGRTICCRDLTTSTWDDHALAGQVGAIAGLAVPFTVGGTVGTLLALHHGEPRIFDAADIAVAEALAAQAGAALSNARLYDEAVRRADRLSAVSGLGQALSTAPDQEAICRTVYAFLARVVDAPSYVLALYDGDSGELSAPFSLRDGYEYGPHTITPRPADLEWLLGGPPLLLHGRDLRANYADLFVQTGRPIEAALVAPLRVAGRVIGQIVVGSDRPGVYDHEALLVLRTMADQAAVALENARLLQGERDRVRHLQELDRMKDDFLSTVSHEVRNPLAALLGSVDMLQHNWGTTSDQRRLRSIERIGRSARRIDALLRDLLFVARMESGALPCTIATIDVASVAREAADELRGAFPGQQVEVIGADDSWVRADPDRMRQILANLLSNAAKYSPEGQPITIRWAAESLPVQQTTAPSPDETVMRPYVVIRVYDRGTGIAVDKRALLFTRFGRLPGSVARTGQHGTGLGLFISRQLATSMGGQLWYEDNPEQGSIFCLSVPALPAVKQST